MNKEDLIKKILQFRKERDWEQFHDMKNMALSLNLEASEVLELFQWTKDNSIQRGKEAELKDELADVYYWLLLMSHDLGIDIDQALNEKLEKSAAKYPVEKSKGKSTKYTEL